MPKLNEIQFTQTSPLTFNRRSKRPYTLNNDDQQISDSYVLQKLQLILISMRQQSTKVTKYFEQQMQKLQSQVNQQTNIITLLQEQNKLLRSHVNIYENKFGGLSKICTKGYQNSQNEQKIQTDSQKNYLDINDDKKQNNMSKMSTRYESNIQISSLEKENSKNQQNHQETSSKYTEDLLSQNGSTYSNFYKKSLPFHHRRQSSLQEQQSKCLYDNHEINILPLITRCQKTQKTEISKISELQGRKNTIIDIFKEQGKSEKQSEGFQQEVIQLGLESKGNGFFCSEQNWISQNKQETLLIQNSEPHFHNNRINLCRYVESRQDLNEQLEIETLEKNSNVRKISNIFQAKNQGQKNQLNYQKQQIIDEIDGSIFTFQSEKNEKDINIDEKKCNEKSIYQKIDHKSTICGQKKLRALFKPLPPNIMSKKINLPLMYKERKDDHQVASQQTQKGIQEMSIIADFNKKKIIGYENTSPLQLAVKKLKRSQEMKKSIGQVNQS